MTKRIANRYVSQNTQEFSAGEDIQASDHKDMIAAQNYIASRKGMRFGGIAWDGTITASSSERPPGQWTISGYFQRPIEGDGYRVQFDFWAKNIDIEVDIYNLDRDTLITTLNFGRSDSSLGAGRYTQSIAVSDATQDGTLMGEPALIGMRFRFSDDGGTWEIGQIDVIEEIVGKDQLIFRRTPLAYPQVIDTEQDGTVSLTVDDAKEMEFAGGIRVEEPSNGRAKMKGPQGAHDGTVDAETFDQLDFRDQGDTSITSTYNSSTGRWEIEVQSFDSFDNDSRVDVDLNGNNRIYDTRYLNFRDTDDGVQISRNINGDDIDIFFSVDVDELFIEHSDLANVSAGQHFNAGSNLSFAGSDLNLDDPVQVAQVKATTRLESDTWQAYNTGSRLSAESSTGVWGEGTLAAETTIYAMISGEATDGGGYSPDFDVNVSTSNYDSQNKTLSISFADSYGGARDYILAGMSEDENNVPNIESRSTGGCVIDFGGADPGQFTIAIMRWQSELE